ncbi:MAG: VWA domain-containing protein [Orrella sp.]
MTANTLTPAQGIRDFVAYLREHGFVIGLAELHAMVRVALLAGIDESAHIQKYWRAIAASSQKQWQIFPDLFDAYWFPDRIKGTVKSSQKKRQGKSLPELIMELKGEGQSVPNQESQGSIGLSSESGGEQDSRNEQAQGGASRVDPLADKPLGEWMPHDSEQLDKLIYPLQARVRRKLIQHYRRQSQATKLDLRESIRKAASTGGELIRLQTKTRKTIMPKVFILVDVSQSMESHANFFLRMARSFCQIMNARAFVFHTTLIEVTPLLKRNSGRVQEKINAVTFGFGGGTRIATNLQSFLVLCQRGPDGQRIRGLGRHDLVFVLSDGFDTDPPDQLPEAVQAIRRTGAELFWLHPTVELPQSKAIAASKADISGFMAVSHLNSLDGLVDLTLKRRRPDNQTNSPVFTGQATPFEESSWDAS